MPFKLRKPRLLGRERKEKPEEQKREMSEWERLCRNPKYYQNLPEKDKEILQEIQQGLLYDLERLPFNMVLDQRKTIDDLLEEAEMLKNTKEQKKYNKAGDLYRQAATLGLVRREIRAKIEPTATDMKLEDVIAYLKLAKELGYPFSYGTVIKYPGIAREIASDRFKTYTPKAVKKEKETEELVGELK